MIRPGIFAIGVVLATALVPNIHGFDDLDDLFSDPDTAVEEEEPTPEAVDIEALTTAPVRFSGSVDMGAGLFIGLNEWTRSNLQDELSPGAGGDMTASFRVTARPQPYLRVTASIITELDESEGTFSPPAIEDLFVDYTLRERVLVRAGTFGQTWGSARVLNNITNIAGDTDEGVAMRVTVPTPRGTATALWYTPGGADALTYAGQLEASRGRVSGGVAARVRDQEDLLATARLTLGLPRVDLTQEALMRLDAQDLSDIDTASVATLSQVVWEVGAPGWLFIGEYLFDGGNSVEAGHHVGVGVRMPQFLPRGWRPNVQWRHAFVDDSGQIETALTGNLAPSMEGSIGIPVIYGPPGSVYRGIDTTIPSNGVVSVGFGARLKFSF